MVSLRLLFISALLVLAVVAASASAAEKVVRIGSISSIQDADTIVVVNLKSQQKLTDSKVTVVIPEFGLRARSNVDFSKSGKQAVHMVIPDALLSDQYVRIVFSSDQGRRVKYRQLILD